MTNLDAVSKRSSRAAAPLSCLELILLGLALFPFLASSAFAASAGEQVLRGGRLVVGMRSEPRTLNPVFATDRASLTVLSLIHGDLVRIDRESQLPVPWLAQEFQAEERQLRIKIRAGVRFSDGAPVTVDDIMFSLKVYLDEFVGSPNREILAAGSSPPTVTRVSGTEVLLDFDTARAVPERLLDGLAVLPAHSLRPSYSDGSLKEKWLLAESSEVVGTGPYCIKDYVPGQYLSLVRNEHYWRRDSEGQRLPYFEEVVLVFGTSDVLSARFETGEIDLLDGLSPQDFDLLSRRALGQRLKDLGPGLGYEFLFFNLNQKQGAVGPAGESRRRWFDRREFRNAISAAIDRAAIVDAAYLGHAEALATHVSRGDRLWHDDTLSAPLRSMSNGRALLRGLGFSWRDGRLLNPDGAEVVLNILTNSSNRSRTLTASLVRQDLEELGIRASVTTMEFRSFLTRVLEARDYDLALLGLARGDSDPNPDLNVFRTGGSNRLWRLGGEGSEQSWQREIDRLLVEQRHTPDLLKRQKLYGKIQRLLAENEPVLFLVAPHVLVAASKDLRNFEPVVMNHPTLWNVDELYRAPSTKRDR